MEENRNEIIEELEATAAEEGFEVTKLPEEPELEGGFDLKSAAIGSGVALLIGAGCYYGPKAVGWIKSKFGKKKVHREEDFNTEDAEDAEFRDADDSTEESEKED